jgi:hypothetical protein
MQNVLLNADVPAYSLRVHALDRLKDDKRVQEVGPCACHLLGQRLRYDKYASHRKVTAVVPIPVCIDRKNVLKLTE